MDIKIANTKKKNKKNKKNCTLSLLYTKNEKRGSKKNYICKDKKRSSTVPVYNNNDIHNYQHLNTYLNKTGFNIWLENTIHTIFVPI